MARRAGRNEFGCRNAEFGNKIIGTKHLTLSRAPLIVHSAFSLRTLCDFGSPELVEGRIPASSPSHLPIFFFPTLARPSLSKAAFRLPHSPHLLFFRLPHSLHLLSFPTSAFRLPTSLPSHLPTFPPSFFSVFCPLTSVLCPLTSVLYLLSLPGISFLQRFFDFGQGV